MNIEDTLVDSEISCGKYTTNGRVKIWRYTILGIGKGVLLSVRRGILLRSKRAYANGLTQVSTYLSIFFIKCLVSILCTPIYYKTF